MTLKDKSTIQRKLGNIEAAAMCMEDDTVAALLLDAVEIIDGIVDKEADVKMYDADFQIIPWEMKCKECGIFEHCPSGKQCVNQNPDFKRICAIGNYATYMVAGKAKGGSYEKAD